jgi:hypothetical protein
MKEPEDAQIQGFFRGGSKLKGVVIVVHSQCYEPGAYYIHRSASPKGH